MDALEVTIRGERAEDADPIRHVHTASFPSPAEGHLVDLLRASTNLAISLVATVDGIVVGHVAFSPVTVAWDVVGLGLAPLAVLPAFRARGVGTRLVRAGLAACSASGCGWVVVLGEPDFYGRFGFGPASALGLHDAYAGGPAFQVVEFSDGAAPRGAGLVSYGPEFDSL